MITGRTYLERGQLVTVLVQWRQQRKTERMPAHQLLTLGTHTPRNVLLRRPDGELVVRPFRGLRVARGVR
ncbi:hypothetical protein [Micromonospora sp. RV43]|uniref:hypothetical protein n=1 Tax=Micromonospora sp. RV43 TaxID=1661387 RepID=UPI00064BC92A|nr:hypothetical protein [Micromonospora sp. RV43]